MSLKKILPVILLILLVYIWFFAFHKPPKPTEKQVLGANSNLTLFIEPNAGKKPIVDEINKAEKEIDIEVYLLSDKDIILSLESAKSKGVAVNVILEEHPFGGGNLNPKTRDELVSHGIAVEWSNPDFSLTHEKAIVIDNIEAFILSQNLTASAFTKNREFDILNKDPIDVAEIKSIFLNDWNRKSFSPSNTDLIESPDNSRSVLESLIRTSESEIDIEVEDIGDIEFENLLKEKSMTSKVNLILPTIKQISSNDKAIKNLESANVKVKLMSNPYVHGKIILVDNKKAYVGSINFSTQSMDSNRELGIIVSQNDLIESLQNTFNSDWENAVSY
jgi:cardiolipin synthase A/B